MMLHVSDPKADEDTQLPTAKSISPWKARRWRIMGIVLVGLVVARGLMILSIMPPFEAWDEYNHVGYIWQIATTGRAPTLHQANIHNDLNAKLVQFPMPELAANLVWCGAVGYAQFWSLPVPPVLIHPHPAVELYEAQHPSFFYRLSAPLFQYSGGINDLKQSVSSVRLANLLLFAISIALIYAFAVRSFVDVRFGALVGFWAATQPLLLLNSARVSNDALAVLLGTLVIVWCFCFRNRWVYMQSVALGVLIGLAIWAKTINLALMPFMVVSLWLSAREFKWGMKKAIAAPAIVTLMVVAITIKYFYFNLRTFGMLTPLGEAVNNHLNGKTLRDAMPYLSPVNARWWLHIWLDWWAENSLWVGGWSFLRIPSRFNHLYADVLGIGLLGWCLAVIPGFNAPVFRRKFMATRLIVLCAGLTTALSFHAVNCMIMLHPMPPLNPTPPWYAAVGVPFMMMLVVGGYARMARMPWLWILSLGGPALMVVAEFYGILKIMIPFYGSTNSTPLALKRLATLHPSWLGTAVYHCAGIVTVLLIMASLCMFIANFIKTPRAL